MVACSCVCVCVCACMVSHIREWGSGWGLNKEVAFSSPDSQGKLVRAKWRKGGQISHITPPPAVIAHRSALILWFCGSPLCALLNLPNPLDDSRCHSHLLLFVSRCLSVLLLPPFPLSLSVLYVSAQGCRIMPNGFPTHVLGPRLASTNH